MNASPRRRKLLTVLALILAGGSMAACQFSMAAGALSGGLALGVAGWLLMGVGVATTQAGCAADPEPNPDPDPDAALDAEIGPCLSAPDAYVGPCLSPIEPDAYVGPCLQPPFDDAGVGPCLGAPQPDVGPCLSIDAQVGPCLEPPAPDAHVGPCLSPPAPDARVGPCLDQALDAAPPPAPDAAVVPDARLGLHREREAVLDRLLAENRLPPDVAARLRKS